jgi:hypothetical protein
VSRDVLDERLALPRSFGLLRIGIRRDSQGRPYIACEGQAVNFKPEELDRVCEALKRCRELTIGTTKDEPKNAAEMAVLRGER